MKPEDKLRHARVQTIKEELSACLHVLNVREVAEAIEEKLSILEKGFLHPQQPTPKPSELHGHAAQVLKALYKKPLILFGIAARLTKTRILGPWEHVPAEGTRPEQWVRREPGRVCPAVTVTLWEGREDYEWSLDLTGWVQPKPGSAPSMADAMREADAVLVNTVKCILCPGLR